MKRKLIGIFLLVLAAALFGAAPARADGIIIPEPPPCDPCPPPPCPEPGLCPPPSPMTQLVIRYHRVEVTIQDQVAVTRADQVFYNPNDWPVEGVYLFPLPEDAAVSAFTLWIDGEPVQGEVLEAQTARQRYEEIVNRLRDPALLEYAGRGALQASVFPIPPQGERRIELEYQQALPAEAGLVRYVYPLNTEKFSAWPLENVSVSVEISSSTAPIRTAYSASHTVEVERVSDRTLRIGYEAQEVLPDRDFALYYSLGTAEAFHVLSYRDPQDPADPDGFFLLLLAPRVDASRRPLPKDLILVLDRSGSMDGEKFQQAQAALRYILEHLNPEDRFNLIAFSTGLERYAEELQPASMAGSALDWVDRLSAQGSTDINRALLEAAALAGETRPTYLIFLTDGLPTEGVIESPQILNNLAQTAPEDLRLFAFGVGYDVDTFLLDSLAQAHHGTSYYVLPGERLDEKLSAFYEKISTPVLTNLDLDFGDLAVYDFYPVPLPDLFQGSQIVAVGRYRDGGVFDVELAGEIEGELRTFAFPEVVFQREATKDPVLGAIPRLWATRKIGFLLNSVRLNGPDPETIEQIVRLSIRYGIVTPYTSYLVTEDNAPLSAGQREQIVETVVVQAESEAAAPAFGQKAVERAAGQSALAGVEAPAEVAGEAAGRVRVVGARAFVHADGVWIDTAFDPETKTTAQVGFLSDEYFALVAADPELAAAFALGPRVIVLANGQAYEVVEGEVERPVEILPTGEPATATGTPMPAVNAAPTALPPAEREAPAAERTAAPCLGALLPVLVLVLLRSLPRRR